MIYSKPQKLEKGDTVAIVSPSWAGPNACPLIYENGIKTLQTLWLKVKEYPTTRASHNFLTNNPEARAKDINDAFSDPEIKAIFASIGWDDSVRILPFLNPEIIRNNPKILMGYSDTTTLLVYMNQLGIVTFHGPSIMAGFSQMEALGEKFQQHIHDMLFVTNQGYSYHSYWIYHEGYPDWSKPENIGKVNEWKIETGWGWLQGTGSVQGQLFGGCIEVLELMKGTDFWPTKDFWNEKILFFETSDEKPSIDHVRYMLRNYGMQWIFNKVSAVLFGRARDYSPEEKAALNEMIQDVISREFWQKDLPIVTNMDFGHTDPQFILPLGIMAEVNYEKRTFSLVESWMR